MARTRKHHEEMPEDDVDLNPLIDIITMLIIFFILGGKLTQDVRIEQITVPPTKTAAKLDVPKDWELVIINVWGNTQVSKGTPATHIHVGKYDFKDDSEGKEAVESYKAYAGLRALLDKVYDHAEKYADDKQPGLMLPKVTLELRCDADTQYRVVQEIQQIVCDSIDPAPAGGGEPMQAKKFASPSQMKPFVSINFTSRKPTAEKGN